MSKLHLPGQDKVAAPLDVVFSRITLAPGEKLLVKIPRNIPPEAVNSLVQNVGIWLGDQVGRVLFFVEGSAEFTKIEGLDAAREVTPQIPGN